MRRKSTTIEDVLKESWVCYVADVVMYEGLSEERKVEYCLELTCAILMVIIYG